MPFTKSRTAVRAVLLFCIFAVMWKKKNLKEWETVSRADYQEILLARMAGGDLYANEVRMKLRKADMLLDYLRAKPLYGKSKV